MLALALIPLGLFLFKRLEGRAPSLSWQQEPAALGVSQELVLTVQDADSGLRRIWIGLVRDGKETVLAERDISDDGQGRQPVTVAMTVEPRKLGLNDGPVVLRVTASDRSWRSWFHGNRARFEKTLEVDSRPPQVTVLSRAHHLNQGGVGLVVYRLSEACPRSGVDVGGQFYPGASGMTSDPGLLTALFALDYNQGPGTSIALVASDAAGNTTRVGFPHLIKRKLWRADKIQLSDDFLNTKMPEFAIDPPAGSTRPQLDKFLRVNRDMRDADYKTLTDLGQRSEPKRFWQDTFLRMPDSAPRAGFADHREYFYGGAAVDRQVHLGVDLASLAMSPVPAANAGRVILTAEVGIYGKTLAIDHGYGLVSHYSHLSDFSAREGQEVARGDIIGHTGTTGMAAGDHLHFGMLLHHTFVNPIEWWDSHWIADNITAKLEDAVSGSGTFPVAAPAAETNTQAPSVGQRPGAAKKSTSKPPAKAGARRS